MWVVILSVIALVQGKMVQGILGLVITGIGVAAILWSAPWRHPDTRYWMLMLPVYVAFFGAVGWASWASGGPKLLEIPEPWGTCAFVPIGYAVGRGHGPLRRRPVEEAVYLDRFGQALVLGG